MVEVFQEASEEVIQEASVEALEIQVSAGSVIHTVASVVKATEVMVVDMEVATAHHMDMVFSEIA